MITYSIFDKSFDIAAIAADVWNRPFIAVGMLAFFLLVPLAVTSTNGMIKRIGGKNWSRLHKLTYLIAVLGVIHFWMIVKSDLTYPLLFGLVFSRSARLQNLCEFRETEEIGSNAVIENVILASKWFNYLKIRKIIFICKENFCPMTSRRKNKEGLFWKTV